MPAALPAPGLRLRHTAAIIGGRDLEEAKASFARMDDAVARNTQAMAKLKAIVNTPKDELLFKAIQDTRAAYARGRDDTVALVRAGKAEEAGAPLLKTVRQLQRDFRTASSPKSSRSAT